MCAQRTNDKEQNERPLLVDFHTASGQSLSVGSETSNLQSVARENLLSQWLQSFFQRHVHLKRGRFLHNYYVDPNSDLFKWWMLIVTTGFIYNAIVIPYRATFPPLFEWALPIWMVFDYIFDLIYLLDLVFVQVHLSYWVQGVLETDPNLLATTHIRNWKFWVDALALFPSDLLYVIPAVKFNAAVRLPRLLKLGSWEALKKKVKSQTQYPHLFRAFILAALFFYAIHIYTCVYYIVSQTEGFRSNAWVYDGNGVAYVRCFYWATVTLVTSHNLDRFPPVTLLEYIVEMFAYLIGVFILALVIGEIRNITEASQMHKAEAYRKLDSVKEYFRHYHIPSELQQRVLSWYDNVVLKENYLDEDRLVDTLPVKMKTDLAIHIHLNTLSKVSLFKDCDKSLLLDLVLKLRPLLFVPGDFICRKGEIGKEMYIVKLGVVEVVSGENEVLVELGPGAVFGEISLLGSSGGRRRTADVRSKGFSQLFTLSKSDLHSTLVDYPEAKEALFKKSHVKSKLDIEMCGDNKKSPVKKGWKLRRVVPVRGDSPEDSPTSSLAQDCFTRGHPMLFDRSKSAPVYQGSSRSKSATITEADRKCTKQFASKRGMSDSSLFSSCYI